MRTDTLGRLTPNSPAVGPSPSSSPVAKNPALKTALKHDLPAVSTRHEDVVRLKREFVESLPEDLRELTRLEQETMGDDWFVALRGEFVKPYFKEVRSFENTWLAWRY